MGIDKKRADEILTNESGVKDLSENPWVVDKSKNTSGDDSQYVELSEYLFKEQNDPEDVNKAVGIIRAYPTIMLELAAGNTKISDALAKTNPGIGIIASDEFSANRANEYAEYAIGFRMRILPGQESCLYNLAVIRAKEEILDTLPDKSLDYIVLAAPPFDLLAKLFTDKRTIIRRKLKGRGVIIFRMAPRIDEQPSQIALEFLLEQGFNFIETGEKVFLGVKLSDRHLTDYRGPEEVFIWRNEKSKLCIDTSSRDSL